MATDGQRYEVVFLELLGVDVGVMVERDLFALE